MTSNTDSRGVCQQMRQCVCWTVLAAVWMFLPSPGRAADKVDFAKDVLPILSDNCFQCHGPDAGARKAKLRLDTKEGALRKTDPVIVPGNSKDSSLFHR